jgi:hypothetical protein
MHLREQYYSILTVYQLFVAHYCYHNDGNPVTSAGEPQLEVKHKEAEVMRTLYLAPQAMLVDGFSMRP